MRVSRHLKWPVAVAVGATVAAELERLGVGGLLLTAISLGMASLYVDLTERNRQTPVRVSGGPAPPFLAHVAAGVVAMVLGLVLEPAWPPSSWLAAGGLVYLFLVVPLLCFYWLSSGRLD